ncbi:hypothetical protein SAMN05660284_02137 [Formivibrio citricus]|uniref:Uncharacterized protein n=1 Tax=Formivibrio citricus TaxID=83765 RepID=A0A1I5BET7_9NEIS|nr:hypothetical protein [Formivibrio citricus]SFN73202.1 hypothetical protein SAMN05660284_02137 [Formivibrio citricus]
MTLPSRDDVPHKDEPLDPLLLQTLKEHGESLTPDGMSRGRIWQRIDARLNTPAQGFDWRNGWHALMATPKRWGTALAFILVAAIGMPLLISRQPSPDWGAVEFKGVRVVAMTQNMRTDFEEALRQMNVPFEMIQQDGRSALLIRAVDVQRLDMPFRQKWGLPEAETGTLQVVFE